MLAGTVELRRPFGERLKTHSAVDRGALLNVFVTVDDPLQAPLKDLVADFGGGVALFAGLIVALPEPFPEGAGVQ